MTDVLISNIDTDGENRPFTAHGHATMAHAGAAAVSRGVFEPGWRWSQDVGPIAKTPSCQIRHQGYVVSGAMRIQTEGGAESEVKAGDVVEIPAGHDAWVVGDEPCVFLDFSPDALRYATAREAGLAAPDDHAMEIVRRGYAAFNAGDAETIMSLFASDVTQHVPGNGPFAGHYKGAEAVLGYYGKLAEHTDGTFRAHLVSVHGDGHGHVTAVHQIEATRNGVTRVSQGAILFTLVGDKVTDLLQLASDLPGDDAFMS